MDSREERDEMKWGEAQPPNLASMGLKSGEWLAGLTPLDPGRGCQEEEQDAAAFGGIGHSVPSAGDQVAFGPELVKMLHAGLRFSSQVGGVLSRVRLAVLRSPNGVTGCD